MSMRIFTIVLFVCVVGCSLSMAQNAVQQDPLYIVKVEGQDKEVVLDVKRGEEHPLKSAEESVLSIQVLKDEAGLKKYIDAYGDRSRNGVVVIELKKSMKGVPESIKEKFKL